MQYSHWEEATHTYWKSKLNAIFTLGGSDAYVLEFTVNEMFSASKTPIKDLKIKADTLIAMIIRDGKTIIPRGNDYIADGDKVIVVTKQKDVDGINEVVE